MARSFTAGSLVTLPRLTAISAARLAKQLLSAAAKEKKLPPMVAAARDAIVPVRQKLATELQKRTDGAGQETPVVRAADIVEDNAFGAFVDWLRALRRLPAETPPPRRPVPAALPPPPPPLPEDSPSPAPPPPPSRSSSNSLPQPQPSPLYFTKLSRGPAAKALMWPLSSAT